MRYILPFGLAILIWTSLYAFVHFTNRAIMEWKEQKLELNTAQLIQLRIADWLYRDTLGFSRIVVIGVVLIGLAILACAKWPERHK